MSRLAIGKILYVNSHPSAHASMTQNVCGQQDGPGPGWTPKRFVEAECVFINLWSIVEWLSSSPSGNEANRLSRVSDMLIISGAEWERHTPGGSALLGNCSNLGIFLRFWFLFHVRGTRWRAEQPRYRSTWHPNADTHESDMPASGNNLFATSSMAKGAIAGYRTKRRARHTGQGF